MMIILVVFLLLFYGATSFPQSSYLVSHQYSLGMKISLRCKTFAHDERRLVSEIERKRNEKLTASDVASLCGISINKAHNELQKLSLASGARMQVTTDGEIVYTFPANLHSVLLRRSIGHRFAQSWTFIWPHIWKAIKLSYGLVLLSSVALCTAVFVSSLTSSSRDEESREEDREKDKRSASRRQHRPVSDRYSSPNIHFVIDLGDCLRALHRLVSSSTAQQGEVSFLESFFSFVFGEPDPNQDYEARLHSAAAALIRSQGGVVTAEELYPYLLEPPVCPDLEGDSRNRTGSDSYHRKSATDESAVLPLLLKFGGTPRVTKNGHIVYVFEELMQSARTLTESRPQQVDSLLERPQIFSRASPSQRSVAVALGVANLLCALAVREVMSSPVALGQGSISFVKKIYPFVLGNAVLYNSIPALRYCALLARNAAVERRNMNRVSWVGFAWQDPQRKLAECRSVAFSVAPLGRCGAARSGKRAQFVEDAVLFDSHSYQADEAPPSPH